jgi:signal transduction histidine kinase
VEVASSKSEGRELAEKARGYVLSQTPRVMKRVMESGRPTLLTGAGDGTDMHDAGDTFRTILEVLGAGHAMVVPITVRDQTLGAVAFISSETGPVYAEDDLELASDVARRAGLAIDNARLFRAAQEAIKARDEVLGTVAHDLGNPLSVISIVSRTLLNKGPEAFDADTRGLIEGTYESSARMARLIDDLLDVSRIDAVGLQLQKESLDPASFLHDVAQRVRPLAENKRISLRVEIDGELPRISADGDRLSQVMWNLLGNAVKFTPEEGSVRITGRRDADAVRVSVIDDGPGIPEEVGRTLFDRFARGRSNRRGVGLGLAISKGIVEAHGGRIWADSRLGEGCAIHFTLPEIPRA